MTSDLDALSREWNEAGRAYARDVQARLGRFHRGEVNDPELPSDPRGEALASRVLDAVIELNAKGQWHEARRWFDPANEPFISRLADMGLPFVVALGNDAALFRGGSTHRAGHLWHVAGDRLTPLPEFFAAAISPDRRMVALAGAEGIRVVEGVEGPEVARFRWPTSDEMLPRWVPKSSRDRCSDDSPASSLEYLCVANTGLRVAIAVRSGVLIGDAGEVADRWSLALPRDEEPNDSVLEKLSKGQVPSFHGDMVHVALTGDGEFLACGAQDDGHYLLRIDASGATRVWAELGCASEYPHNACFSSDGTHVAFNACHFYNGATIAAEVQSVRALETDPHAEDSPAPVINAYLRVYASTWLPEGALPGGKAAFALAGASALTIVTPAGEVQQELLFGSSASGIDYCPATQTLVLASHAGVLHFLRPSEIDAHGLGFQPPRETKRWCFLKDLPPVQW